MYGYDRRAAVSEGSGGGVPKVGLSGGWRDVRSSLMLDPQGKARMGLLGRRTKTAVLCTLSEHGALLADSRSRSQPERVSCLWWIQKSRSLQSQGPQAYEQNGEAQNDERLMRGRRWRGWKRRGGSQRPPHCASGGAWRCARAKF